jgi:uncharacterized membrane protein YkvA (DUF1232 family)
MQFIKDLISFFKNVSQDSRIPDRDKMIILSLVALIISPVDLIPDWIPFLGQLDDLVLIAVILDYFFRVLDAEILLSHWPWNLKSYSRVKKFATLLQFFVPKFLKKRIWKFVGRPY